MQPTVELLQITDIIFSAIDELNQRLPLERQLTKKADTVLFGESGCLKSLELVSLILLIENKLEEEWDIYLSLTDERAMSQKRSPFQTVARLSDYINLRVKELDHE